MPRAGLVVAPLLAATLLACGSEEDAGPPDSSAAPASLQPASRSLPRESIGEATRRITRTASSADCSAVNKLTPLSRPPGPSGTQCQGIQALAGLRVARAAAYGRGGGMIDYVGDDGRTLNAVLVLDADGLYHLARIEYGPPSVETPLAPGFGAAARRTANALRAKDCAAFRKLIPRSSSKEDPDGDDACASVTIENSLANLLGTHPDAEPRLIGGNNGYAFYGIDSPEAGFTLILRHQPSSGYSYLDSLLTSTGMIRLPDAKESPGALANRVAENGSSSDCTEVYELNPLSRRPAWDVQTQCRGFQALARLDVADASAYGGGAIVEYKGDDGRLRTGVFMLDADGLYHLTGIDGFLAQSSVGTRFDRNFDEAAEEAVKALRDKDCAAFRAVALQRYGSGANPDALCDYVANNPLLNLLTLYPTAQPQRLGGNDSYAFYGIGSPEARFTIVMARESTSGPPGTPALPEDAPEYGFVDAFRVTGTDAQVTSAPPWRPTDNS